MSIKIPRKKCLRIVEFCLALAIFLTVPFCIDCNGNRSLRYDVSNLEMQSNCVVRAIYQASVARKNGYDVRIPIGPVIGKDKINHCQAQAKIDDAWYFLNHDHNKIFTGEKHEHYRIERNATLEEAISWL